MKTVGDTILKYATVFMFIIAVFCGCQPDKDFDPESLDGIWDVSEQDNPTFGSQYYQVDILESSSDTSKMKITNFGNLGSYIEVNATFSNSTITIASQDVREQFTVFNVQGEGIISSNRRVINMSYMLDGNSIYATYRR